LKISKAPSPFPVLTYPEPLVRRQADLEALAQTRLLSPWQFHRYVRQLRQETGQNRLYFGKIPTSFRDRIPSQQLHSFFDALAETIGRSPQPFPATTYHLHSPRGTLKLRLQYAGSGAIGRVVKLSLANGQSWAFKAFFEPDFVWQHGAWAEIPIGIYLRSQRVTRDIAQFHAAGLTWTLWEWIDDDSHPHHRPGIDYRTLAQRDNLTALNPLNSANYNPHGIRLDPGGIQSEMWGRRGRDAAYTLVFYLRRLQRDGWQFLSPYFNRKALRYTALRLGRLLFSRPENIR
jgi:hypothetical protein